MRPPGDEYDEMTDGLGVRRTAGGQPAAGDDDVTHFLTELRALGDGPAPEPSRELAALLAGAHPFFARRVLVQVAVRTALVAAVVIGLLVAAAANHSLPQPAQKVVSHVVNVLTPFHIDPRDLPPATTVPTAPPVSPSPAHPIAPVSPADPSSSEPEAGDDGGPGGDDGGSGGGDNEGRSSGRTGDGSGDSGGQRGGSDDGAGGGDDGGRTASTTTHRSPSPSPTRHEDDGGSSGSSGSSGGPSDD